jgi:hypothetical protein
MREAEKKKEVQAEACNYLIYMKSIGADYLTRTGHLLLTKQLLYQMS